MKKSELPRRLSVQDAAFANFERDTFPMNVGSVGIYEGDIDFERFLDHVDSRIQLVPRYWQRLVAVPGGIAFPAWVDDPDFDLRNHLTAVTLPPPGSDEQLAALAAEFFATPIRRDRPLWEIRLVRGLSGGRTAHVAKIHHCLVDGVGGVGLLAALLDATPEARPLRARRRDEPPRLPGVLSLVTDALFDRALQQVRLNERFALSLLDPRRAVESVRTIARAFWEAGPYFVVVAPPTPWSRRLHSPNRVAWESLPFEDVHTLSVALHGSINDLALALIAGGLGRYLESQGVPTGGLVLRAGLPVNVRHGDDADALGNRVSFMLAGLPVGVRDARERFRLIHREVAHLKRRRQADGIEELSQRLGDLPPVLHTLTGRTLVLPNFLTNLICTNVPGPLQPLYMLGHRMLDHYPWVPLGWRMGLGVAVMSYDTRLYFAVTADRDTPGDIALVTQGIRDAFHELRGELVVPQPYRREPAPAPPPPAREPALAFHPPV